MHRTCVKGSRSERKLAKLLHNSFVLTFWPLWVRLGYGRHLKAKLFFNIFGLFRKVNHIDMD